MIIQKDSVNRYAVYVFYDKDGIVDEYNEVFLDDLRKNVEKLLVICNGEVTKDGLGYFERVADEVIVRPNEGFDITAYKIGIKYYGYETLKQYDEVIVLNSTSYGPLYPFAEMFQTMSQKDLDFWGITQFHEVPFDPFGTIKYGYIPKHIQSYFMVFRKSLLETEDFSSYWDKLPKINSYEEAVGFHETIFTKEFADKGYKWDVYVNTDELEGYTYEGLRDFPKYMIERKRCPIIKRRSFFQDYGEAFSRSGGEATKEALDYIEKNLDYDTGVIYKNLLRVQNQADLKKRMQWNYVLSSKIQKKRDNEEKMTVAMIIHIYYAELAAFCASYVSSMPIGTDVYVTVPDIGRLKSVKKEFDVIENYNIEYRIVGNVGRDVAPFLVGCKDVMDKYDLICKVHDKKVYQIMPMSIGASWQMECFDNLLYNKVFVENVITLFQEKKYLGMLTPPVPKHGAYYPTTGKGEWGDNYKVAKQLAEQLGLNVNIDEQKEPVAPLGSMFWARTKALKALFAHDWQYDEFPKEPIDTDATILHAIERIYPFVVQNEKYYPGWIMSDWFARIEMTNWRFMNREIEKAAFEKTGYCDFRELLYRINKLS